MKILDLSYHFNPLFEDAAGLPVFRERYLGYLRHLAENHEVTMFCCSKIGSEIRSDGIRHWLLRKRPSRFWLPFFLHRKFGKERLDAVIVHGMRSPVQAVLLRLQLGSRVKIFQMQHAEKPSRGFAGWLQKLADRWAVDGYFFASLGNAQLWLDKKIIASSKKVIEVMEISSNFQPIEKKAARRLLGLPLEKTILLWVGRLHPVKDPLTVLRGFDLFLKNSPPERQPVFYLIFQNEDLLPEVQALLAASENLKKQVWLVGKIEHPQLENWFSAADFFTLGSKYEGSGTALAEAMACGCVPVVSDISAFRSITGVGLVGWLFQTGEPSNFAEKLTQAIENQGEKPREKIIEHFKNHLSWRAIASKIEQSFHRT